MRPSVPLFAIALLLTALAAAPHTAAEPTCQDLGDGGFACVEVLGGPEAGGIGVDLNTTAVHTCVAFAVQCPGDSDG